MKTQLILSFLAIWTGCVAISSDEPSCDELRQLWQQSKREMSVAAPRYMARYKEPRVYGWEAKARPRTGGRYNSKPVYGRVVHSPDKFLYRHSIPGRYRSFDQVVARMVGSQSYYQPPPLPPPAPKPAATYFRLEYPVRQQVYPVRISHVGRFDELQNVLRNERASQMMQLNDGGKATTGFQEDMPNSRLKYPFPSIREETGGADESGSEIEKYPTRKPEESDYPTTTQQIEFGEGIPRGWALGEWRR